ncbi:MAG: hypothetical protein KTR27_19830 [Leptolyngbyaceae cyanobacterium MAG.088]|nr:hypothetical protein [Leptolyngbyaceae cyanobacterium MAG.088]
MFQALMIESYKSFLFGPYEEYFTAIRQHLDKLNETGILDNSVYRHLHEAISTYYISSVSDLYRNALDWTITLENLQSPYVNERLNALQQSHILSPKAEENLLIALDTGQVTSEIGFFNYIDQAALVNLDDYSPQPYLYLPKVYEKIAKMLDKRGILNDNFGSFQVIEAAEGAASLVRFGQVRLIAFTTFNEEDELSEEGQVAATSHLKVCEFFCELAISATYDNQTYQQAGIYDVLEEIEDNYYNYQLNEISAFFNQILRDQGSPYRLYTVSPISNEKVFLDVQTFKANGKPIGFIALTEEQRDIFFNRDNITLEERAFLNAQPGLNSDVITDIVDSIIASEMLTHLPDEQIAIGKARIAQNYIIQSSQILTAFENVIVSLSNVIRRNLSNEGDLLDEGNELYQALTLELASISRGAFQPSNFETTYDDESQTRNFSFDLNGNRYSQSFPIGDGSESYDSWHCLSEIVSFIVNVAVDANLEGRFYQLTDQYNSGYLFLTDTQYETLERYELFNINPIN